MIRIMLCCASGMSTSLLVEKMKKAGQEKGIQSKADVILLGPQVRYAQKAIEADANGVPVDNIGMKEYGMMNGAAVLEQALSLINK